MRLERAHQIVQAKPPSFKASTSAPLRGAVSFGGRKLYKDMVMVQQLLKHPLTVPGSHFNKGDVGDRSSHADDGPQHPARFPEIQLVEDVEPGEATTTNGAQDLLHASTTPESQDVSRGSRYETPNSSQKS